MDEWGEDLDADVVEEILLASQATEGPSKSYLNQSDSNNSSNCRDRSSFEFKQPLSVKNEYVSNGSASATLSSGKSAATPILSAPCDFSELEKLKEENKRLIEANQMKAGEASILRADVQSLRSTLEKRELESSQQLVALKNQVKQMDSNHLKQIEASKTEMKFKELELEELRSKCKRIEQGRTDSLATSRLAAAPATRESPTSGRGFLNKTAFDAGKLPECNKISLMDVEVQTEIRNRFRLDPSDSERLDVAPNSSILIDSLKYGLESGNAVGLEPTCLLLDQLRLRILLKIDEDKGLLNLLSEEPSIGQLVCNNLERLKNSVRFHVHIDFLSCWIVYVLPHMDKIKSDCFIQSMLSEIKHLSFNNILILCSAAVTRFGLSSVCNKKSGCLFEKAAVQLKDAYPSLNLEDQFNAAQQLTLALSAMLAASTSGNLKKCPCIVHLLKALTLVIQHLVEVDGLSKPMKEQWLKLLPQAFRVCYSILHCHREPWQTIVATELNRLYTVLTAISVDCPTQLSNEINVIAFYSGPNV